MALGKKSVGQKRAARQQEIAKSTSKAKTSDPIDKLVAELNKRLGGQGRIYRGGEYQEQSFARRSTGIPTLDYILNGGMPKPGLVEFGGEFSSGKTTVAIHICAHEQKTNKGAVGWISLEPFSKRWARENGFFIPFSEELVTDSHTGEERPRDSFENATDIEKERMAEQGIEDPYSEVSKFVIVEEERGDTALQVAVDMLRSNLFAIIVVDSLGLAKSTSWLEERGVEDAGDYDRTPKMIGDYTARACLALNKRYDENNEIAKDGMYTNQTTLVNLNQIVTAIGTQAHLPWKKQTIKGGEGNKHNHHAIVFLSKGEQKYESTPHGRYVYGQEIRTTCIKSKIGAPFREGSFDLYTQPHGAFKAGDIDLAKDATQLGIISGLIERSGAWYQLGDKEEGIYANGLEAFQAKLREWPEMLEYLATESARILNK